LAGTEILLEGFVSFLELFTKDQSAPGGGFIFRDEGRLGSIPRAGTNYIKQLASIFSVLAGWFW